MQFLHSSEFIDDVLTHRGIMRDTLRSERFYGFLDSIQKSFRWMTNPTTWEGEIPSHLLTYSVTVSTRLFESLSLGAIPSGSTYCERVKRFTSLPHKQKTFGSTPILATFLRQLTANFKQSNFYFDFKCCLIQCPLV